MLLLNMIKVNSPYKRKMSKSFVYQRRKLKRITLLLTAIICNLAITVSGQLLIDSNRVIFPKEKSVVFDMVTSTTPERFTPTLDDIDNAEIILNENFHAVTPSTDNYIDVEKYFRQYVGLIFSDIRYIFIIASCKRSDNFLTNTFYPKGGGVCYFRGLIDIDSKKVFKIYVNAPK